MSLVARSNYSRDGRHESGYASRDGRRDRKYPRPAFIVAVVGHGLAKQQGTYRSSAPAVGRSGRQRPLRTELTHERWAGREARYESSLGSPFEESRSTIVHQRPFHATHIDFISGDHVGTHSFSCAKLLCVLVGKVVRTRRAAACWRRSP